MRLLRRLAHWWRFRAHEAELEEELAFHRAAITRDLVARGMPPAEAAIAARRAMGNESLMREDARGVWLWPSLEAVLQDARTALRSLRKSPTFTAGVMLTFALGVGANAAMFSLIDRLLFRPPPFMREPATVHRVYLYRTSNGVEQGTGGQYARNADLERFTTSFSTVARYRLGSLAVGIGQDAREMPVGIVSASFFDLFDAPPVVGRYFTADEDAPPMGAPVAVLTHATWMSRYRGRQDAIGSTLKIGAVTSTIIGVAPQGFVGLWTLEPPVAFVPVTTYAASRMGSDWATTYSSSVGLNTIVRRKPGVTVAQASADLTNALIRSYRVERTGWSEERLATLRPRGVAAPVLEERGPEQSQVTRVAIWLAGVTVIVLLIACANVANLLLTRALARKREIAVRLALGVSRRRLVSQLLTESTLLAIGGSALGVIVAVGVSTTLSATFLPGTLRPTIATDPRTLAFIAAVTLVVGVFTGLLPVLQARRLSLTNDLKSGSRSGTYHRSRARIALLVLQGALSLVLLVGAGLFVRSLRNVRDIRLGFDADSVLVVEMEMRDVTLDSAGTAVLRQRLLSAATTVSGISHASFQFAVPFRGETIFPIQVDGIDSTQRLGLFRMNAVSPDYFATMRTRLLRGRGIEPADVAGAPKVMVIGVAMGAALWPGQDPLGKCVRIWQDKACTSVVGIAEDIHTHSLGPEVRSFFYYVPAGQLRPQEGGLFVRATGDPRLFIEPLRRRLQGEMPGASYVLVTRMSEILEAETRPWVMGATLFTAFGILALVLAVVGLYSVIAYNVAQRRHELAVRLALGAGRKDVVGLVMVEGLRLAAAGTVSGAVIALGAGRWIGPLLFNQSPRDPVVLGAVAGALLLVAVAATAIPAMRAARVDPNAALRAE